MSKKTVCVLFGGRSGEHEVSVRSAASVMKALDREKYTVVPIAISSEGRWIKGLTPDEVILESGSVSGKSGNDTVFLPADPGFRRLADLKGSGAGLLEGEIDVIIPVLHGTYGEDGAIQGLLELANVPYVGSGVLGSALGMDKVMMKKVLAYHGIPQPRFLSCLRGELEKDKVKIAEAVERELGYPCFIKPANLGSSVGISKAHDRAELLAGMTDAAAYDRKIIVEEHIDAREVEVSVLGNDDPAASLPGEIIPLKEFYDYEAKYVDGLSQLKIPAELPEETVVMLRDLAVQVFKALECSGLSRVDFFLLKKDGSVMVNEINTLPGFTDLSMYPKLWEATGIPYSQLLDRLIELALERHREKSRNKTTFTLS
ncbi:MAG: D-alanine--D-alanine ligase [Peptococcaceae bacterium BICA1-7]|nr:MAG: D-alanine--D-alanine ligase [Peptococcaceae bacterium BICA1-7]HBV96783.1 D-alanine--D-alanine ligase [Desulfotomaculum sp.]